MENQFKSNFLLPLLFSVVLIIGMFLGFKLSKSFPSKSNSNNTNLDELVNLIHKEYVDSIDIETLNNNGIEGILKTLDPHTVYIPKQDFTRANEQLIGEFYGIGVEFFLQDDTVYVSSIIPNGPSQNKGLFAGDKIIKLDSITIAGKALSDEEVINKIRGQKNKPLKMTVLHPNNKVEIITIKRGIVPIKSIQSTFKLNDTTGYISIKVFSENTYEEFKEALSELVKQKITHLIIDVRDNPGGYMDAVAKIADELIAGKHTLVSTIGKNNKDEIVSSTNGIFEKGKVTVLINEYSASASEILAGIVQDLDRGKIIGRRSYGKGLVQEQFELPDHSGIRITVARYYLPSGRCIQKSYIDGKEKYEEDIETRYKQGKLTSEDSTDNKLSKKYFTIKKRPVMANQGISPDIFVKLDTSYNHKLIYFYTNHIAEIFTHNYFYFHQNEFSKYTTFQQFHSEFKLTDTMKFELIQLLIRNNIPAKIINDESTFAVINSSLKASFSKLLFNANGKNYEQSFNDKIILKALEN